MMKLKLSNPYMILQAMVIIAILFIAFYVVMKPFAMTYDKLLDEDKWVNYTNESSCTDQTFGHWVNGACQGIPLRASQLMIKARYYWLAAPIILAIGILIWMIMVSTRKDPQEYRLR